MDDRDVAPSPALPTAQDVIDVLIVDDSVVVRRVMTRMLGQDPRFNVAAAVASGAQALAFVRTQSIDLVLLDMNMPGDDGLTVLAKMQAHDRLIQVVLLSATCHEGSDIALKAMAMGASDVIAKPDAGHFSANFLDHLRDRLLHLMPSTERARTPEKVDQSVARLRPTGTFVRAVGVGGSTGGISAVTAFLAGLPERLPIPVFVTQHLPANFQPLFADQLRRATPLPILIAEHGLEVRPGAVYIATGDAHLSLQRNQRGIVTIQHSMEPCLHGAFPAVDPMFRGLARAYGAGACGVLLSGMGRDGLAGAQAIVENGGWIVAQDHSSSAVWGMPGSVVKAGLTSAILSPGAMAHTILRQREDAA